MLRSARRRLCCAGSIGSSSQLQLGGAEEQQLDEQGGWFLATHNLPQRFQLLLYIKSINVEFCWWHLFCDLIL